MEADNPEPHVTVYRESTLGRCLDEALSEMVDAGRLPLEVAHKVLAQFDKSMLEALKNLVETDISFKGHIHTYRYCENQWSFLLEDLIFKINNEVIDVDTAKLTAYDEKLFSGSASPPKAKRSVWS